MKAVKVLTMVAMGVASLSPLASVPAAAMIPSPTTESSMDLTCSTWLSSRVDTNATLHDGVTPVWSVEVEVTGASEGPPTPVPGSGEEVPGTRVGKGSATYSDLSIYGDPYRSTSTSQSSTALKSLFGDRVAGIKNWSNSEYRTVGQISVVTTYTFKCNVFEQTETYHPPVYDGGTVEGYYTNTDAGVGGYNGIDPDQACLILVKVWGQDYPPCLFTKTGQSGGTIVQDEYWEADAAPRPRPDHAYSGVVTDTTITEGEGDAYDGGPWAQPGTWYVSKVMVCSPPKKSNGTWTVLNGYTGNKCTKAWFNVAPWGGGSAAADGSYIPAP